MALVGFVIQSLEESRKWGDEEVRHRFAESVQSALDALNAPRFKSVMFRYALREAVGAENEYLFNTGEALDTGPVASLIADLQRLGFFL